MKIWNYRTFKGRRFYRLNHADLSKSMFFLSYYRILHTAYLKRQRYCITAVKKMFVESFGLEPDAWSISYITDTEKCFVNDIITEALNKNGRIDCPNCLRQMLIEIGFDTYLIKTVSEEKKPDFKSFYAWLPMKKERSLKKAVKCFWKERLPKEKLLFNLYYQLEPYKREILTCYRKMLLANDTLMIQTAGKEVILEYINENLGVSTLPVAMPLEVKEELVEPESMSQIESDIQTESNEEEIREQEEIVKATEINVPSAVCEEIEIPLQTEMTEETADVIPLQPEVLEEAPSEITLQPEVLEEAPNEIPLQPEVTEEAANVIPLEPEIIEEAAEIPLQAEGIEEAAMVLQKRQTFRNDSALKPAQIIPSQAVVNVQKRIIATIPDGRGFQEKNKMTRKKAVTCAVCVAAAGALLVPLVAYTVIKHKAA